MNTVTYSHSGNATARIFLLKPLIQAQPLSVIITESHQDLYLLRNFASSVWGRSVKELLRLGDILSLETPVEGVFFCHPDIFRSEGNLYEVQKRNSIAIMRGDTHPLEYWIDTLLAAGYTHDEHLDTTFSYKKEWGVLSIRTDDTETIYQCEWFDTEIDSILAYNRIKESYTYRDRIVLPKATTSQHDLSTPIPINTDLLEHLRTLPQSTRILIWCDFLEDFSLLQTYADVHFSEVHHPESISAGIEIPSIQDIGGLKDFLVHATLPVVFLTRYEHSAREFLSLQMPFLPDIQSTPLRSLESCILPEKNPLHATPVICITDDILGTIFIKQRRSKHLAKNLDLLISLKPGDLVVHRDHGIGRFDAIREKTLGTTTKEYLELHYSEWDKLFVPITEVFRISKYLGDGDVALSRLSGKEWENTIGKTDEELQKIAEGILETNARRKMATGRAFPAFPDKEYAFRKAFKYEHTTDQSQAIDDIFQDMESSSPMDRLLSGDVGFGKTEVAMNAAYKAVLGGTQVALISPLVVLALEHYETFLERMADFWVRIALLTRMNTERESEAILEAVARWEIDVLIGTHRLLSSDVRWRKLGLLIIDEEHKFWVTHKEAFKKMRAGIDILTLSATPIPRSLNLALSGLRQISLLSTPPKRKKPIETIITRWHDQILVTAITRELDRWGQIIILHNRIRGLESITEELSLLFRTHMPDSSPPTIVTTHGRMSADDIESRIHAFKDRSYDILLTTTIIENGVNFLSANTIIILDPEDFGLASLHQLRGRVGRKTEQGYCYLVYRKSVLSDDEKKRLITIANNNHLGAGFEIAMRDMEIRWAGDILGIAQSGNSKAIGLPLYFRMLEEKISALRNERATRTICRIELDLPFRIDDTYFLSELDKLNFYREIENIDTIEELEEIERDMHYRTQKKSESHTYDADNLFLLLRARIILSEAGIERVSKNGQFYVLEFPRGTQANTVKSFLDAFDRDQRMILVSLEKIRIDARVFRDAADFLEKLLPERS